MAKQTGQWGVGELRVAGLINGKKRDLHLTWLALTAYSAGLKLVATGDLMILSNPAFPQYPSAGIDDVLKPRAAKGLL